MRLVALLSCLMLLGCFPNNPKHRTYAKLVEGGMLVGGIVILAIANTGADCDMDVKLGAPKNECKSTAGLISGFGLALVVGGLVGFMATVTTQGDDKKTTPPVDEKKATPPTAPSTTPTPITPVTPVTPAPAPATP